MIKFEEWFENEDETRRFYCEAKRGGITGKGQAYSPAKAKAKAMEDLSRQEQNLTPTAPNWESSIENFLIRNSWGYSN